MSDHPAVFVSYSHEDEPWLKDLLTMLAPLEQSGLVRAWSDGEISPGQRWRAEIEAAMVSARVGVFLVSPHSLASKSIMGVELPHFLEAARQGRATILWALLSEGLYEETPLQYIQPLHDPAQPLDSLAKPARTKALKAICHAIESAAKHAPAPQFAGPAIRPHVDLGRLPLPGPHFVGRDAELARLDAAWEDPNVHILTFVAFGGMGKSTLVGRWLDGLSKAEWRGARRVLDWSFYSQGTEERVTSADPFLDHALEFFGDSDPSVGAARDRGLRLAELMRREKTLLILDGVEPLQHPPGPLAGRLKDPGLAALLKSLAASNPGLCVVTTRERIADLENFPKTAPQVDLEALTPEAGAELLRYLGVKGMASELRAASDELGNHALSLTLLGHYLRRACGGDVRRRREVDLGQAAERLGGHALRVIRTYARWLGEGPEVAVLRLHGLFDRSAGREALAALRAKPAIPGLTEPLVGLSEEEWQWAMASLREQGLLLRADPRQPESLDAHPLVRVYFQEELEKERPQAWQEGNLRLYEHLKGVAPDLPETPEAMEPLYAAVLHGCRAGRQQEALGEVYRRRIQRDDELYNLHKLGAFGSDLAALAGFFDRPWDQPSAHLRAVDQAYVLHQAAADLRALGRLAEAVPPMQAGLERAIAQEDWKNAALGAGSLSELTLALGEVGRAVAFGEQSVALADRSGDAIERMVNRSVLADALHQAGRWKESAEAFREAEALQVERQPEYPRLYSLQGYRYCDLLVGRGEPESGGGLEGLSGDAEEAERLRQACQEVRERAGQTLEWMIQQRWLLDIALDHLSLGRSHLGLADFARAAEHLDRAVEGLRRAGQEDYLPLGLLARATFHRLRGNLAEADTDLTEAAEIAERGGMRLHLCDAHLERARLALGQSEPEAVRRHVARARQLVAETGYRRREREVVWLETKVHSTASGTVDPLHLAFQLVLGGYASPNLLQSLHIQELLEALAKATQDLPWQGNLSRALEALKRQKSGVEPNPLWLAWMWETRKPQLQDLVNELLHRAERGPTFPLQSDEWAETSPA